MKKMIKSSDASYYYHEDSTANVALLNSSAVYGNLADAMKDSIVVFPDTLVLESVVITQAPESEGMLLDPGQPLERT